MQVTETHPNGVFPPTPEKTARVWSEAQSFAKLPADISLHLLRVGSRPIVRFLIPSPRTGHCQLFFVQGGLSARQCPPQHLAIERPNQLPDPEIDHRSGGYQCP